MEEEGQAPRCYPAMNNRPVLVLAIGHALVGIVATTNEVLPLLTHHLAQFREVLLPLDESSELFAVSKSSHTRNFGEV
jgi:hypothetical protein